MEQQRRPASLRLASPRPWASLRTLTLMMTMVQGGQTPAPRTAKTVNNINKWNQVQEELTQGTTAPPASVPAPPILAPTPVHESAPLPQEKDFEFSDMKAISCLLCARKFKAQDQLERHNKESDLHKARKNFKDGNLRDIARQKAEAARDTNTDKVSEQPKYRDRASERRIMHNQPDTPMPDMPTTAFTKKAQVEAPPASPSPPPLPVNPGQDQNNVGNKLLKMMGWTEGTGLGTTGEGRIEPIQTAIYAQGVGLGASKGKEVGKYADGYKGYLNMAQDAARDRYHE
ncbi:hypothetical protein HWV62_17622 [Athelia sp. TMB]|nr:hypothetical protein HWV62_17622 [Athelia sp. TMB]